MEIIESAELIGEMITKTQVVYLRTDPEVLDFTNNSPGKIIISGGQQKVDIDVNRNNVIEVAGLLSNSIFDKTNISMIISWNIKSLFSYFKAYFSKPFISTTSIVDLQVIEKFLNITEKQPENLSEALNRTKAVSANTNWKPIYKTLHLPLMLQVLPSLETTALLDEQTKSPKFAFYEIEGQTNGRLRCPKKFEKGYIPHTLGPTEKQNFKPRGLNQLFISSDIKHCEVSVLQWLSKDEVLGQIMKSDLDLYSEIYKIITQDDCDSDKKRKIGKEIFLKVIYGIGSKGLSEELKVSIDIAKEVINRTYSSFPTATDWIKSQQNEAKNKGTIQDYFGRPRTFTEDTAYLARNFVVQGVAATVCLEKLIELHRAFQNQPAKLCFSIHDAYGFTCSKEDAPATFKLATDIIKTPSVLCPGLILKVESKYGKRLDSMVVIGKKN